MSNVISHLLKMIHVCIHQPGTVSRHLATEEDAVELSHALCGPIAEPPVQKDFTKNTAMLREVITAIRENERNRTRRKFPVEQTILVPSIMLATAYNRCI